MQISIGEKYGAWTIVGLAHIHKSRQQFQCRCDCGTERTVDGYNLSYGSSVSCGCLKRQAWDARILKHGDCKPGQMAREYIAWCQMKTRCYNPKCQRYANYGGRGIYVCERWLNSYPAFLADMGRKPSPRHSLDRIDVHGHYEPSNCRWATDHEQRMNKQNSLRNRAQQAPPPP